MDGRSVGPAQDSRLYSLHSHQMEYKTDGARTVKHEKWLNSIFRVSVAMISARGASESYIDADGGERIRSGETWLLSSKAEFI